MPSQLHPSALRVPPGCHPSATECHPSSLRPLAECLSGAAQEHVTELLLQLSADANNRFAIASAGAIPKLIAQLRSKALRVQLLAAAVVARLTADERRGVDNVAECAAHGGVRPLIALLEGPAAEAQVRSFGLASDGF